MKYGLIGERLGHSFSKDIHGMLSGDPYELVEIERSALDAFMHKADFKGINVTIPYKEAVMPYLDTISGPARKIGSVNTIVNKDGRLFGYNTDFGGLLEMARNTGIDFKGRGVLVLGAGGAAKTAAAVAQELGASSVTQSSRHPAPGQLSLLTLAGRPGLRVQPLAHQPCAGRAGKGHSGRRRPFNAGLPGLPCTRVLHWRDRGKGSVGQDTAQYIGI